MPASVLVNGPRHRRRPRHPLLPRPLGNEPVNAARAAGLSTPALPAKQLHHRPHTFRRPMRDADARAVAQPAAANARPTVREGGSTATLSRRRIIGRSKSGSLVAYKVAAAAN